MNPELPANISQLHAALLCNDVALDALFVEESVSPEDLRIITNRLRQPFAVVRDGNNRPIGIHFTPQNAVLAGLESRDYYLMDETSPLLRFKLSPRDQTHSWLTLVTSGASGKYRPFVSGAGRPAGEFSQAIYRETRIPSQ